MLCGAQSRHRFAPLAAGRSSEVTFIVVSPAVTPTHGEEYPLTDSADLAVSCLDLHSTTGTLVSLPDGLASVAGMLSQFTLVVVSLTVYS